MSEEEKEAIELLKQEPDYSLGYYKREKAIDVALNYIDKLQKVIDLMAEQMSKRPLMIFQGNENLIKILKEPKEIIDYYTKKAEE